MFTKKALLTVPLTLKRKPGWFSLPTGRVRGSQAGFTLIEIIVSLILVGILAAMGGTVIVQVINGYMAVRENTTMTQKSQLAMSRIAREVIEMINIPSDATATLLPINNINGNRTIGLDQGAIKIAFGADTLANGDILIDNVSAFSLTYYSRNPSSGAVVTASTWPSTNDITTLTSIDINLQLNRADGGVLTFANRVAPRNNKNQGGAAPSLPPPSAPQYGACFVVTAAYGDPGHPAVQILRDFRDRYLPGSEYGRWLMRKYYEHGPATADLIHNRPLALLVARGLLTPLALLAFFLVYAPLAIPLLIALILTCALFAAVRRGIKRPRRGLLQSRGSVMIGLIITMVIMATLSAAMLPMFSASNLNQVYADQGRKTYFLAESGFRYAASSFLNAANEPAKLAALTAMNNKTCNLLDNAGSFTTKVYPYWFKTQAAAAGATTLTTQVYGTTPAEFTGSFPAGQIRVGSSYYSYTSGSGSGTTITFSGLSPALPAIPATPQLDVQPVTQTHGSAQNLSKGGSLTLSATGSGVFPVINGNFILHPAPTGLPSGSVFNYSKRSGTTLSNITLADGKENQNWTGAYTIPSSTRVILDKFISLSSTGTIGGVSREVIYNVPVGWIAGGGTDFIKAQDSDPMTTAANWVEPAGGGGGTHSVQTIDGGSALKVDAAASSGGWWTGTGSWAMTFFQGYSNTNLAKSWLDAQGALSYDIQVKVYNTQPYFFAGMNFRARNNSDNTDLYSYGLSLIKPRQTRFCFVFCGNWGAPGDLATQLIPGYVSDAAAGPLFSNPGLFANLEQTAQPFGTQARYGLPAIVLWKRTAAGFQWLAYRILTTADGIVFAPASPANALRLTNWSSLLVRVVEGYPLTFTNGGGTSGVGVPIKEGDIIETLDTTSSARVVMTPILTSGSWASRNAAGTMIVANVTAGATPISNATPLYVNNVQRAVATGSISNDKANYLRVYYGRPTAQGTANAIETDNNRLANPRNSVNWPPDDLTELTAVSDYFTLVQWTGYNTGVSAVTSISQPNAIIREADLITPAWNTSSTMASFVFPNGNSGDNISLTTSSGAATMTYYDDFAIQLDQKAGAGFLPPIQQ